MPYQDKADLRASVRNFIGLTTEVSDQVVNDWITLAEADLNRRLRVLDRQETTSFPIDTQTEMVPTGFRGFVDLVLDTTPKVRVRLGTVDQVRVFQAVRTTGPPRVCAVKGDSTDDRVILFGPVPDQTYASTLTFWKAFSVNAGEGGSELMERWSDAWLYGTLIHAHTYLGNDPQVDTAENRYLEAVQGIIDEQSAARAGGLPA